MLLRNQHHIKKSFPTNTPQELNITVKLLVFSKQSNIKNQHHIETTNLFAAAHLKKQHQIGKANYLAVKYLLANNTSKKKKKKRSCHMNMPKNQFL